MSTEKKIWGQALTHTNQILQKMQTDFELGFGFWCCVMPPKGCIPWKLQHMAKRVGDSPGAC
jgi:hypothetical protein